MTVNNHGDITMVIAATKRTQPDGKEEIATQPYHLVHVSSDGKPLCGVSAGDAKIGAYVEHLDDTSENVRWVREIFDSNGKAVVPCHVCLSLYPPVLLDVVPFNLTINLYFKPNKAVTGYNITTSASAKVGDIRGRVDVLPALSYFSATWLGNLRFSLDVDANSIVPLVECANKAKR